MTGLASSGAPAPPEPDRDHEVDAAPATPAATGAEPTGGPRRTHTVRWIALGVALAAAAFVAVLATRESAVNRLTDSPLLGQPAPRLAGQLVDVPGAPSDLPARVDLAELRGRYVVVNFFASWCIPCVREHPELVRFQSRHGAAGDATVLAVVFDDEPADVRRFFRRHGGGGWPVIDDPEGRVALDWGVRGPPESFLVDPDGFVLFKITGEVDADGLERLLRQAKSARPSP